MLHMLQFVSPSSLFYILAQRASIKLNGKFAKEIVVDFYVGSGHIYSSESGVCHGEFIFIKKADSYLKG